MNHKPGSLEELAQRILSETRPRPGAHWDRWPTAQQTKKKAVDLEWLEFKYSERNNPQISITGSTNKDWKNLADLIKAIEKENGPKIKRLLSVLVKSPLKGIVGPHELNWSWEFSGAINNVNQLYR